MPEHIRALIVLLVLATAFFIVASMRRFGFPIERETLRRRRNLWFGITLLAFLSHNLWIFLLLLFVLLWIHKATDANPIAIFCVVLLGLPPFGEVVPGFAGLNQLLYIDTISVAAMAVLVPQALRLAGQRGTPAFGSLWPDRLLVVYLLIGLYGAVIALPTTAAIRVGIVYPLVYLILPYYVASRLDWTVDRFRDLITTVALVAGLLALIAMFEHVRYWLLYESVDGALGLRNWSWGEYLHRGTTGRLRAVATSGHSLVLGFILVFAITLYAFLRFGMAQPRVIGPEASINRGSHSFGSRFGPGIAGIVMAIPMALLSFLRPSSYVPSRPALKPATSRFPTIAWNLGLLLLLGGLVASMARGPWVGLVAAAAVFLLTGPGRLKRASSVLVGVAIVGAVGLSTEPGRAVLDHVPFIGKQDSQNVDYRTRLFSVSLEVIAQRPLLGDFHFMKNPRLETMRNGEGIIDIVNSYLEIALRQGLLSLAAFVGVFAWCAWKIRWAMRRIPDQDGETHVLGRALLATLVGVLVTITTVSSVMAVGVLTILLAGLCIGYVRMVVDMTARKPGAAATRTR
jgi:hypothetical protein